MNLPNLPSFVEDINGQTYTINQEEVSMGGQGVFIPQGEMAVKILFSAKPDVIPVIEASEKEYRHYQKKLIHLMALPRLEHVSLPIVPLKSPYCGYVMRFMKGLKPLSSLMRMPSEKEGGYTGAYAAENCDLKKRICVLRNLAELLRTIHHKGLVYCDLTPSNIFVSEKNSESAVWLIDVDNIEYGNILNSHWQTPWYRAPEVYAGQRNTAYSDCYSFALIAFEFLTCAKPFDGTMAEALEENAGWDDEDDWDVTAQSDETAAQKKIESGVVPYVGEENTKNKQYYGIPWQCVMTEGMQTLFQATLGKEGREHPASRPTMNEWFHVLDAALDQLLVCSKGHAYLGDQCFLCHEQAQEEQRVLTVWQRVFYAISAPLKSEDGEVEQINETKRQVYEAKCLKRKPLGGKKDTLEVSVPWKCFADSKKEHHPDTCAVTLHLEYNQEHIQSVHCHDAKLKASMKNISGIDTVFLTFKDRFHYQLTVEKVK